MAWLVPVLGLAMIGVSGCRPCASDSCSFAVTAGRGDGSYVPAALEASADQFLVTGSQTGGGDGGGSSTGPSLPKLQLDRETLSPDSNTAFSVAQNRGIGLRVETHRALSPQTQVFAAISGGRVSHQFYLPEGLGPLSDPTRINFGSSRIGAEVGIVHERALLRRANLALRLSLAGGYDLVKTQTTIQSALLDIANTSQDIRAHATLGAGVVWQPNDTAPQIEVRGEARLLDGGQGVLRSEIRLSYP